MRRLTIVLPVLDEAVIIVAALEALKPLRARGAEVIVVHAERPTAALGRNAGWRIAKRTSRALDGSTEARGLLAAGATGRPA